MSDVTVNWMLSASVGAATNHFGNAGIPITVSLGPTFTRGWSETTGAIGVQLTSEDIFLPGGFRFSPGVGVMGQVMPQASVLLGTMAGGEVGVTMRGVRAAAVFGLRLPVSLLDDHVASIGLQLRLGYQGHQFSGEGGAGEFTASGGLELSWRGL